jgi:hypothetical protein
MNLDNIFKKADTELRLERISDDEALIRLDIGVMSFGIGQPRNGLEAASVLRTFRDALTTLLSAAYSDGAAAWQPIETAPEDELILVATTEGYVDTAHWTDDGDGVKWWWSPGTIQRLNSNLKPLAWMPLPKHPEAA